MDDERTMGEELNQEEGLSENVEVIEQPQQSGGLFASLPDILRAKTGPGSVEEYLEHPLNFSKNMGLARIIRGSTGILGALDLAIITLATVYWSF
jgi:hypothetical protein